MILFTRFISSDHNTVSEGKFIFVIVRSLEIAPLCVVKYNMIYYTLQKSFVKRF